MNDGNVLDEQSDDFDPATAGTQAYSAGGPAVDTSATYSVGTVSYDSQGRTDQNRKRGHD